MSFITTRALFYQFTESSITASFPPIHSHKPSTHSHIQTASVEVGSHRGVEHAHTYNAEPPIRRER